MLCLRVCRFGCGLILGHCVKHRPLLFPCVWCLRSRAHALPVHVFGTLGIGSLCGWVFCIHGRRPIVWLGVLHPWAQTHCVAGCLHPWAQTHCVAKCFASIYGTQAHYVAGCFNHGHRPIVWLGFLHPWAQAHCVAGCFASMGADPLCGWMFCIYGTQAHCVAGCFNHGHRPTVWLGVLHPWAQAHCVAGCLALWAHTHHKTELCMMVWVQDLYEPVFWHYAWLQAHPVSTCV